MATLTTSIALDMDDWNLGNPADGDLGAHNAHHFTYSDHGRTYDFGGHGFDYFGVGSFTAPCKGTVSSLTIADSGVSELSLTGISIDVPTLEGFVVADQMDSLAAYLFRDDDTLTGSSHADILDGFTGDDTLYGRAGGDTLKGGLGGDTLTGGMGADKFAYDRALDSTSTAFDTVTDFDAGRDAFVFDSAVGAVDGAIAGGRLSQAHFDANLAKAADDDHLAAHHAVLFVPDAGVHAGETFLVVDLNGDAGYQAGEDSVIHLADTSHLVGLNAGNFLVG